MRKALVGATGFVGTTLQTQTQFNDHYNSSNIEEIRGKSYDLLICAAAPATKWKANQYPAEDIANIQSLMRHLSTATTRQFLLISTIDVYPNPVEVDEDTAIQPELSQAYGKHRYILEDFARQSFPAHSIVRLPGLFGNGLKKNFIYDLIHSNCLHLTHCHSIYQFYNLERLWKDLQVVIENKLPLTNFATEPVRAQDVAQQCFNLAFDNVTDAGPVQYDMRTKFASQFGSNTKYFFSSEETFSQIRQFASNQKRAVGL